VVGYIAVIIACVTWASGGLLVRFLSLQGFQPMTISFLRVAVAWMFTTVFVLGSRRRRRRVRARDLPLLALLGIIGPAGSQPLFIATVTMTTMAVATILNYTSPIFVTILGRLFLGERITRAKLAALAVTIGGLVLVTGVYKVNPRVSPAALAVGTASGLLYGLYTLLLRKTAGRFEDPILIQWWSMMFGLPLAAVYSLREAWPDPATLRPAAWAMALANGSGPGFLAFILFTWGLGRVQASRASIVATVEPVAAAVLGYAVFGEGMGALELAGVCAVLAGILIVTSGEGLGTCQRRFRLYSRRSSEGGTVR
jgi:drug/metabolite transporter (DMT)-like permease